MRKMCSIETLMKKKTKFWKWGLPRVHMLYNCVEYQEALFLAFGFAILDICWSQLMGTHTFLLHSSKNLTEQRQQQI